MNNSINKSFLGLPITGISLMGISAASIAVLVANKLIPVLDGTVQAELLAGAEGGIVTFIMAVFAGAIGLAAISYLLMIVLGVNALRLSKNPTSAKTCTGLAKFLIFIGIISLLSGIVSMTDGANFWDNAALLCPAIAQIFLIVSYMVEVKSLNNEAEACA